MEATLTTVVSAGQKREHNLLHVQRLEVSHEGQSRGKGLYVQCSLVPRPFLYRRGERGA